MTANGHDKNTFHAPTLAGDLRDRVLGLLRGWRKAPHELSETEQVGLASEIESWARQAVQEGVALIASKAMTYVAAEIKQATIKPRGVEVKLLVSREDADWLTAAGKAGTMGVLVLADPGDYYGERAPVRIDKDQPDLQIEEEDTRTTAERVRDQWAADDAAEKADVQPDEKAAAILAKADEAKRGKRKAAAET